MNIAIVNPIFRSHAPNVSLISKGIPKIAEHEIPEINMVELGNELAKLGNDVTVYAANAFVGFEELHINDHLTVRSIPTRLKRIFVPALLPFMPDITFCSRLKEADVIQCSDFHQFSTFFASNVAAREKIAFVVWQEAFRYMRPPAKPFQRLFEATSGRSIRATTSKFVLRSKKAGKFLQDMGIHSSAIGRWIPSGINGNIFHPRVGNLNAEDFGFPKDFALILLVSRLVPSKRVDLALHTLALLRKKGVKAGLLIAGSGPELDNLRAIARQLKIDNSVRFLGLQSRLQLAELDNSSDVFLFTSESEAGPPFALLEAGACGLPAVATRLGGIEDFVEHGINGLLVSWDPADIADSLEKLIIDADFRERLGKASRDRFVADFEMRTVARHLEESYKECL